MTSAMDHNRPIRARWALRAGAVTCLAGAAILGFSTLPAAAAAPSKTAWWNTAGSQTASTPLGVYPPVTPPSPTPKGDLQVSNGPAGQLAFAAVQYSTPSSSTAGQGGSLDLQATLTLSLDKSYTVGTPAVVACPTVSPWSAGPDQAAGTAPQYDCGNGASSTGTYSSTKQTVTFSLTPAQEDLSQPGTFSLAIVPAPGSTSSFVATFSSPGKDSFELESQGQSASGYAAGSGSAQGASTSPSSTGGSLSSSGPNGSGYSSSSYSNPVLNPPPFTPLSSSGGSYVSPSASALSPTSLGATSTASPGPSSRGSSKYALGTPLARSASKTTSPATQRTLAILVLVALGVALAIVGSKPTKAPSLVRPLAFLRTQG
ncbi:MAG: hypothetical protein M1115_04640 [Actinobacteria bacterium]|nr:hypothetical protein [Actinomycetota bacterium]